MTKRPLYLVDGSLGLLGTLDVSPVGEHFEGTIDLGRPPEELRQLFLDFEEIVEGQMFSLLDAVEERIRAAQFRVIWNDGQTSPVEDLQVFPSTRAISFSAAHPVGISVNGQATSELPRTPVS